MRLIFWTLLFAFVIGLLAYKRLTECDRTQAWVELPKFMECVTRGRR